MEKSIRNHTSHLSLVVTAQLTIQLKMNSEMIFSEGKHKPHLEKLCKKNYMISLDIFYLHSLNQEMTERYSTNSNFLVLYNNPLKNVSCQVGILVLLCFHLISDTLVGRRALIHQRTRESVC